MTVYGVSVFTHWERATETEPRPRVASINAAVVEVVEDVDVATRYLLLAEAYDRRPHGPMDDDSVDSSLG